MSEQNTQPATAPAVASSAWLGQAQANILEALGSIVETRCYLQKMRRLSKDGPLPDWTAVIENLQGALRESETVLVRVQRLYNAQREWPNEPGQR